jgi:hypothetical protein
VSALSPLRELGLLVSITDTGLRLSGLSALPKDQAARVVEYAKEHKPAIIAELSAGPRLPEACPFLTGDACPPGCRFETRLFLRMIETGVLPTAEGCPLLSACGLLAK